MTASEAPETPARPMSPPRRWGRWLAAATVVAALLGAGLWWLVRSSPVRGDGGFGVGFSDVEEGQPFTIGLPFLCLEGADSAVVEDVTVDPAGLTVVDFAVRHAPSPPADAQSAYPGSLRESGFGGSRTFDAQCDDGEHAEIAVEVVRAINGPAVTEDVDVHWSSGLRSGVHTLPVGIALCRGGEVTELCPPDPEP